MHKTTTSLKRAKQEAMHIAKELLYPQDTQEKLKQAESIVQIERILATARMASFAR